MKALLFFIFIIIIFLVLKAALKRINKFRAEQQVQNELDAKKATTEKMVTCHSCGVHIPQAEALAVTVKDGEKAKYACSKEHLTLKK